MDKQISSLEPYFKVFVKCAHVSMPVNLSAFPSSPSKQASIPVIATSVRTQNFTPNVELLLWETTKNQGMKPRLVR